ncbi:MAG TPA: tetratricopeptide repeat protein, partial [Longimicrobiales bacterium]|nr:tetratricopeptide repeat protein [Longimicrobiales bacterium]
MTVTAARMIELVELARSAERDGDLESAIRAYEAAFAHLTKEGDAADAAELLRWIGTVHRRRGDLELAEEAYLASEAVAAANNDTLNLASALNCLGVIAQFRARIDEAVELYDQARQLANVSNDERLAAMIEQNIGTLANTRGDIQSAIASYLSALKRFQKLGDEVASVWALNNLGMAYVDLREWPMASSCYDDAFDIADRLRDPELLGTIELNRAELHAKKKELTAARDCCDRAFEIFSRIQSKGHIAEAFKFYGIVYREMQRPGLAISHFDQAVDLAKETEDKLLEAETQAEWALLELNAGDNRAALHRLNRSHQLFEELHASADLMDLDARLDRLEETYMRVMQRWAESIESKDRYTAGHCERVADYACMLAENVGFEGRDLTWFRMGAYLHDVGKTAVPTEVLNKPGKLTDEEWVQMQRHTVVGDQIVAELDFPWDIRPLVRSHHERWDGTGYPDNLAGEDIPFTARILCVADVYDALTTARSYRPALPREEA